MTTKAPTRRERIRAMLALMPDATPGERIVAILAARGLSQRWLAQRANIDKGQLSRLIRDVPTFAAGQLTLYYWSRRQMAAIAKALGVSIRSIWPEGGAMTKPPKSRRD